MAASTRQTRLNAAAGRPHVDVPFKCTPATLHVLDYLADGRAAYADEIVTATGRALSTVRGIMKQLLDHGWADCYWDQPSDRPTHPRARYYWLDEDLLPQVHELLSACPPPPLPGPPQEPQPPTTTAPFRRTRSTLIVLTKLCRKLGSGSLSNLTPWGMRPQVVQSVLDRLVQHEWVEKVEVYGSTEYRLRDGFRQQAAAIIDEWQQGEEG